MKEASVSLEESDRFEVSITYKMEGDKNRILIQPDNRVDFATFEEVKEYLIENADEKHKDQFRT